nr:hypothetical protein K-LCC10_0482 [Kaumoebavirus]
MHARRIVDSDMVEALDEILPVEITDMVLPHLLENGKKIKKAMGVIKEMEWEEDPVDYSSWKPYEVNAYRCYVDYSCGVYKAVDRCKQCLSVSTIQWYYGRLNGIQMEYSDEVMVCNQAPCGCKDKSTDNNPCVKVLIGTENVVITRAGVKYLLGSY